MISTPVRSFSQVGCPVLCCPCRGLSTHGFVYQGLQQLSLPVLKLVCRFVRIIGVWQSRGGCLLLLITCGCIHRFGVPLFAFALYLACEYYQQGRELSGVHLS